MSQGKNSVTETKKVKIVFDPFTEETTKYYKEKIKFKTGAGAKVELSLINIEDSERNIIRLQFDTTIDGSFESDAALAGVVSDFVLNVDGEVLKGIDKNVRNKYDKQKLSVDLRRYTNTGWVDFSLDDVAKIVGAENLEARYYSEVGFTDLDDKTERKLTEFMRGFTNEVIQSDDFKEAVHRKIELVQEISQARISASIDANGEKNLTQESEKKPSFLWKLIKWTFYSMILLVVIGVFLE